MADYPKAIGKGGLWLNESKSGVKYMAGEMTFSYNGHEVTAKFAVFKNTKKEGKQPDYSVIVNDSYPAKAREPKGDFKAKAGEYSGKEEDNSDLPF